MADLPRPPLVWRGRPLPPRQDFIWSTSDTLLNPPGLVPFAQLQWPNPRWREGARQDWVFASPQYLLALVQNPFPPSEWPVTLAVRGRQDFIAGTPDTLLNPPGSNPTALTDWPNPRGYLYPIELRTFLQGVNLPANPPLSATLPFSLRDWPNPWGPAFPVENRGFTYSTDINLPPATLAAITGTATTGITEADVQAGGKTIIITLTNDTWAAAGAAFDAQRQNILDGLASTSGIFAINEPVTSVVRTSDTVVTITLTADPTYDIVVTDTITDTVPASALTTSLVGVLATPSFTVSTNPVPPPTVDYQSDGKKRRRRRRQTDELFDSIERSLREALYGPTPEVPSVATIGTEQEPAKVARATDEALRKLTEIAEGYTDLSDRVAAIRAQADAYEARRRKAIDDDDEDVLLLSL